MLCDNSLLWRSYYILKRTFNSLPTTTVFKNHNRQYSYYGAYYVKTLRNSNGNRLNFVTTSAPLLPHYSRTSLHAPV